MLRGGLVSVGTPLIRAHGLLGGVFVRTPAEGGSHELVGLVSPGPVPALQSA